MDSVPRLLEKVADLAPSHVSTSPSFVDGFIQQTAQRLLLAGFLTFSPGSLGANDSGFPDVAIHPIPMPTICNDDDYLSTDIESFESALQPQGDQIVIYEEEDFETTQNWWTQELVADLACGLSNLSAATGVPSDELASMVTMAQGRLGAWTYLYDPDETQFMGINYFDAAEVSGPQDEISPLVFHELGHSVFEREATPFVPNHVIAEGFVSLTTHFAYPDRQKPGIYPTYSLMVAALGDDDLLGNALEHPDYYMALAQDASWTTPFEQNELFDLLDQFATRWSIDSMEDWIDLHELYTTNYVTGPYGLPWEQDVKWSFFRELIERNDIDWSEFLEEVAPDEAILGYWRTYSKEVEQLPHL